MSSIDFSIGAPIDPQVGGEDDEPFLFEDDDLGGSWDEPDPSAAEPMTEERVRSFLVAAGQFGNLAHDRDVPDQWLFTDRELDALVPPLTSIANRHNFVRMVIEKSDYVAVPVLLASYGKRNLDDGRTARENRKEIDTHGHERAEGARHPAGGPSEGADGPGRGVGDTWGAGVPAEQVAHVRVDAG